VSTFGNVGIGTASPLFATAGRSVLDVNGSSSSLISLSIGGVAGSYLYQVSNDLYISNDSNGSIINYTGGSERMRLTSAGNLGIGTSSPGAKLEVAGASRFTGSGGRSVVIEGNSVGRIDINGDGAAYATGILFNSQLGGTALSGIWNYGSGTSQQWLAIGGTAYNNSAMYILPSGNVGIGTSSPSYKLQVNDTIATVTSFGNFTALQAASGTGFRWTLNNDGTFRVQKTADGFFNISATPIIIDSSNRIGIGTTSPGSRLTVVAGAQSDTVSIANAASHIYGADVGIITGQYASGGFGTWIQSIRSSDGAVFRLSLNPSGGLVGIGIATSNYPLHVGTQVSNVSIYADYDIVAFSDQSVKENIRPIENALERVIESRGVLYDRIDSGEKDNIGFIAQELEVAFPELVVTNQDGTKAVKYQNAVAVLFEAVKEQQKQIDEIKRILNGITN
jgi:hypothetical protein